MKDAIRVLKEKENVGWPDRERISTGERTPCRRIQDLKKKKGTCSSKREKEGKLVEVGGSRRKRPHRSAHQWITEEAYRGLHRRHQRGWPVRFPTDLYATTKVPERG